MSSLYRFVVVANMGPDHGVTEKELVLAAIENIVDVVEARAIHRKIEGVQVEKLDCVMAMTLPQVVPPNSQDEIRNREERQRREASPISEIDRG